VEDQATPAAFPPPLDAVEVERFVDGEVEPALRDSGVPGAIVVVVRSGHVVLSKGYGVADLATRRPVRPDVTLFDTASIGKSMTAIITEQLVDEGLLDLDVDVNRYLKPSLLSGPTVTLRMLLGHRGAFDADITGLFVPLGGDIGMTVQELRRRLRPVAQPGVVTAYDNQGFGVIALVLRQVSGKALPDLYRERLFEPAGMRSAVLGRPADGNDRLARCYTVQGPRSVHDCEYWLYREGLMGAGGVAASADDMARYMRLLLNNGVLDGRRVLSEHAFADLTDFNHYRFHPGMPGLGRAFVEFDELRGREYGHGGSMPGFSSLMKLYPEADVGIFVSFLGGQPSSFDVTLSGTLQAARDTNIQGASRAALGTLQRLPDLIAERFIPATRPHSNEGRADTAGAGPDELDGFLGRYVLAEAHSRSIAVRLHGWFETVDVERSGPRAVRLGGPYAALGEFRRIAPGLFENAQGRRLAFERLQDGYYMAVGLSGGTYRRTNSLQSPAWGLPVLALCLLIGLSALVHLRRRASARMRRLAAATCTGLLLVTVGLLAEWQWGVTLGVVEGAIVRPLLWRAGLHLGVCLLLWAAVRFYLRPEGQLSRGNSAHAILIVVSACATAVVMVLWRVVGAFPPYVSW
jgi:CubicO group peptidase (beta-lactamase class C family)